jgi:hypothetical protein
MISLSNKELDLEPRVSLKARTVGNSFMFSAKKVEAESQRIRKAEGLAAAEEKKRI